jgi:predicted nucleic acid-binding protein
VPQRVAVCVSVPLNCSIDGKPLRLVADTNVLLDLADGIEDILDALAAIDRRLPDAEKLAPPTVLEELAFLADSGQTRRVRESAHQAFRQLQAIPVFRPVLETPFAPERADELAEVFRLHQLLPSGEVNDSLILAETVLLGGSVLLTSDSHLCSIDHEQLTWVLTGQNLSVPVIATPREIVRKFFR